jgi:hypothetical protein
MTALRSASLIRPQVAISLSVRKQPSHQLVFGLTEQTRMQGETIDGRLKALLR